MMKKIRIILTKSIQWLILYLQEKKKHLIWSGIFGVVSIIFINCWVIYWSHNFIKDTVKETPKCYTGLILGAFINQQGVPSYALKDRLDRGIELYQAKKITRILVSGDHGQTEYDEVNHMKNYLVKAGIPETDIFLDHAGFDTYNSMVRAKKVFLVQDVIIITQAFHLPRAVYIAKSQGLKAYGIKADKRQYHRATWYAFREIFARIKAFMEVTFDKNPKFLGEKISIYRDSKASHDK